MNTATPTRAERAVIHLERRVIARKKDEERHFRNYNRAIYSAAMALYDCGTTDEVMKDLEQNALVSFFVGMYGDVYPLKSENRRFHKVAEDIRGCYAEILHDAVEAEMRHQAKVEA